jgi:hypothetical protein
MLYAKKTMSGFHHAGEREERERERRERERGERCD